MLVSGVVAGTLLGLVVGKDWRRLSRIHIRLFPMLLLALALRGGAPLLASAGLPLYIASIAATGLVAGLNRHLPGTALIAVGSLSNLVVVWINGGMPVDLDAVAVVAATMPSDALHMPLDEDTRLTLLADVLPIPLFRGVYSVGDVLIAIGAFCLPFITLARR